jgi:signal transduction histidine kinase
LLLVARYERDPVPMAHESIDLAKLAEDCIAELSPLSAGKSLNVHIVLPKGTVALMGNKQDLRRLFINLIDNAIKFSPQGGEISIIVESSDDSVAVTVSDSGKGVSEEDLSELFQRFTQRKKTRRGAGAGLGLYLCRRIVEGHGGKIFYSPGKERGSEFSFHLPLSYPLPKSNIL